MTGQPMRASDQDRDEAVLALSDHYADGRLDHDEFEARMTAASQATYLHDLDPLFADLPPRPRPAPVVGGRRPLPGRRPGPHLVFAPVVVLLVVTAMVLSHGRALWLLVPMWWIGMTVTRRRAWHLASGPTTQVQQHPRPRTAWHD